ncbi:MAG: hypothetical protein KatS3mg010_1577 [Acidimicrobiia bacterium]|nr:MAG: hypothetical protein KatS3mg010_1577 [Acidimicrobiia bacterium]
MSERDVDGFEMGHQPDFDDPALADLIGAVRRTYGGDAPEPSAALRELFEGGPEHVRSSTMRRTLVQLVAATGVLLLATGGLAAAGALPGVVQDAVSSAAGTVGVDLPGGGDEPAPGDGTTSTTAESTTTSTTAESTTPTSGEGEDGDDDRPENHGAVVSEVARDKSLHGCEHGRAVSSVASGKVKDTPCPGSDGDDEGDDSTTTTTTPGSEGPSTSTHPTPPRTTRTRAPTSGAATAPTPGAATATATAAAAGAAAATADGPVRGGTSGPRQSPAQDPLTAADGPTRAPRDTARDRPREPPHDDRTSTAQRTGPVGGATRMSWTLEALRQTAEQRPARVIAPSVPTTLRACLLRAPANARRRRRRRSPGEWRSGSAPALGAGGRGFESPLPDARDAA